MFDKYEGIINLDQVLYDKYNYNFDGNLEDFYNQNFIKLEGVGKDALCWILYDGVEYLFKPLNDFDYNIWGELLTEEIAKDFEIPCASYRVGKLHGQSGIISRSFLKENDTLILGSQLFQDFLNSGDNDIFLLKNDKFIEEYQIPKYFFELATYDQKRYTLNYLNNLEHVKTILNSDDSLDKKQVPKIVESMTDMLIFDLITLQGDRHPNNWGIVQNGNKVKFSPLFDNAASFGLGFRFMNERCNDFRANFLDYFSKRNTEKVYSFIYQARPNFTLSIDNVIDVTTRLKDTVPIVLEKLFYKSDFKMREKISNLILGLSFDYFDVIIKRVESLNGIKMEDDVYFYISNVFELNINNLKNVINKCWRNIDDESRKNIKSI